VPYDVEGTSRENTFFVCPEPALVVSITGVGDRARYRDQIDGESVFISSSSSGRREREREREGLGTDLLVVRASRRMAASRIGCLYARIMPGGRLKYIHPAVRKY
jgi:hypothetical protein